MTAGIIDERTDVADDGASLITSQFRKDVVGPLERLVRICCDEVQRAESLAHDLITERLLSTAVGVQLDQWGKRLGCPRLGMGDDDYRALLYVWILVLNSDGQADQIKKIVRLLMGADAVIYRQAGIAHFVITYDLATPSTALRRLLLGQALVAAVSLGVSWTLTEGDSTAYFGFAENPDPACKGFDEGYLSDLVAQVNQ